MICRNIASVIGVSAAARRDGAHLLDPVRLQKQIR
jgi:hypothetical protein